ncbi:MAG: hypothetical protein Q8Q94_01960 [bacterium]|nr:hypothetical protein [bacterium]MDZ4299722.1 hypothetical protein [Candidatus Sungbacteria bacterium]
MRRITTVVTGMVLVVMLMTAGTVFAVFHSVGSDSSPTASPPVRGGILKRAGDAVGKDKQQDDRQGTGVRADKPGGFCARIDELIAKTEKEISGLSGKVDTHRAEQVGKIEDHRQNRDLAREKDRSRRDATFLAHIAKLKERADTDAKKQAVASYEQIITAALAGKQTSVDAITAAYRTAVDKAVADRQAALRAAVSVLTATVKTAEEKARTDCAAGIADATIRTAFMQAIKAARQRLTTDRKAAERVRSALAVVATARQQSLKTTDEGFRASIELARQAIEAAFGKTLKKEATPSAADQTNQ